MAALDQPDHLVDQAGSAVILGVVAFKGELVAAQVNAAGGSFSKCPEDGILGSCQIGGNLVVQGQGSTRQAVLEPPC